MKLLWVIGTTGLLLLGATAASHTPQDRQEQGDKPEKQEEKAKPERKEKQDKPTKQAKQEKQEEKAKQEKPEKREENTNAERQGKSAKQEDQQAKRERQDNHVKQQQGAQESRRDGGNQDRGNHGRISDEHYRASFGSGHNFRVNRGDYDHRRFQYGGYSFGFIDPWPVAWYYTDDVYVVYDDGGYYMYDVVHPGVRISVNIL